MNLDHFIICASASHAPAVAGSITVGCHECGRSVVLPATGQRMRDEMNLLPICARCAARHFHEDETPPKIIAPTGDQLAEIADEVERRRSTPRRPWP